VAAGANGASAAAIRGLTFCMVFTFGLCYWEMPVN